MSLEAMLTKGDVGGCSETMRRLAATFVGPSVADPPGTFVSSYVMSSRIISHAMFREL